MRKLLQTMTLVALVALVSTMPAFAKSTKSSKGKLTTVSAKKKAKVSKVSTSRSASKYRKSGKKIRSVRGKKKRRYYERFTGNSFATNQSEGDRFDGEDQTVRQAALDALGNMNGSIVVVDPMNGRILTMVNQKVALSSGAIPCSTIKPFVGLAALSEGLIDRDTEIQLGRRWRMNLTYAMAHSNNPYFEVLGRKMGFSTYSRYAQQFGLGELAGWNIEGEHLGEFPSRELDARRGGVGRMSSFGEGILMTPLQLAAFMSAVANGGTLYYLQHPLTTEELSGYEPKVKRQLSISQYLPDLEEGMLGATLYGTGRSVRWNFDEEQVLGKTGTCSESGTRYGWFGAIANTQYGKLVAVTFLQGGRPTFGPKAAEITGRLLKNLQTVDYFASREQRDVRLETTVGVRQ